MLSALYIHYASFNLLVPFFFSSSFAGMGWEEDYGGYYFSFMARGYLNVKIFPSLGNMVFQLK